MVYGFGLSVSVYASKEIEKLSLSLVLVCLDFSWPGPAGPGRKTNERLVVLTLVCVRGTNMGK
jgi:hypothetical protein